LLAIVSVPLWAPAAVGAKRTVSVCWAAGAMVKGMEGLVAEKSGLLVPVPLTRRSALPVLRTVSVRSLTCPTVTVPKSSAAGATSIAGAAAAVTVKVAAPESPPPGAGLDTVTAADPAAATSDAGMAA
jgi:hypothetical protein